MVFLGIIMDSANIYVYVHTYVYMLINYSNNMSFPPEILFIEMLALV